MRELLSAGAYTCPATGGPLAECAVHCTPDAQSIHTTAVTLRTFIVEDNATIRENLIGTLEELASIEALGWAESEADARAWLTRSKGGWDLAIVDLFLRQGSGLGVLEACRARGPRQRVVVLSNYATTDMRKRCSQLGADAVFDKSNEIDALIDYCMQQSAGQASA
jgi:two-component system, OmpR family, response regulator